MDFLLGITFILDYLLRIACSEWFKKLTYSPKVSNTSSITTYRLSPKTKMVLFWVVWVITWFWTDVHEYGVFWVSNVAFWVSSVESGCDKHGVIRVRWRSKVQLFRKTRRQFVHWTIWRYEIKDEVFILINTIYTRITQVFFSKINCVRKH